MSEKAEADARYYEENREAIREKQRAYYQANRERIIERSREHAEANPRRRAEINRKARLKQYGLTIEQYDSMVEQQGGLCIICGNSPDGNLHVEHCHQTSVVRGLTCGPCNSAMGMAGDDPVLLRKMADYLEAGR